MAIFEEQLLEPYVSKGIGNSGVASRTIQASDLPDLRSAINESTGTMQNLDNIHRSLSKAKGLISLSSVLNNNSSSTGKIKKQNAIVLGKVMANKFTPGGVTVAFKNDDGTYSVQTHLTQKAGMTPGANFEGDVKRKNIEQLTGPLNFDSLPTLELWQHMPEKMTNVDIQRMLLKYADKIPQSTLNQLFEEPNGD